jgi:hypothetical protein
VEEIRPVALKESEALRSRRQRMERLEHNADALSEHYAGMVPETLDSASTTCFSQGEWYPLMDRWRSQTCSAVRGVSSPFCEN